MTRAAKWRVGRRIYSQTDAKRAASGRSGLFRLFLLKPGETLMSVDQLDGVEHQRKVAAIARAEGASRPGPFRGWAKIPDDVACANGRKVKATPVKGNPHHAEIVLPEKAATDRGVQIRHAHELADASVWQGAPTPA